MFHVEHFFNLFFKMTISGKIIDIHLREIYGAEIFIDRGVITDIRRMTNVPEQFIMPGLVDSHVHIESSMLTPGAFATAVVSRGTVAVVSDPHEIANVLGLEGVKYMIEDAKKVPVRFFFGAPSCVPATTFETSGAVIGPEEIEELLKLPEIRYLSEMMNYPGVINENPEVMKKIETAKKKKIIKEPEMPPPSDYWIYAKVTNPGSLANVERVYIGTLGTKIDKKNIVNLDEIINHKENLFEGKIYFPEKYVRLMEGLALTIKDASVFLNQLNKMPK